MSEVVVGEGSPATHRPEHRLAIGGVGLGAVIAEQLAQPEVRQRD